MAERGRMRRLRRRLGLLIALLLCLPAAALLAFHWANVNVYGGALRTGMVDVAGALVIDFIPRESMTDFTLILGSIFGGGMLAIYLLGFFTRRVGNAALLTGVGFGLVLNGWLLLNTFELLPETWRLTVHPYWTTILVNALVLAAALLASLLFPNRKNLARLTVWTREPEKKP